jgi:hypothetical protein
MKLFQTVLNELKKKRTTYPGKMGELLASMGITEDIAQGPSGIPMSVLTGCVRQVVVIPGSERPAMRKNGEPMISKMKVKTEAGSTRLVDYQVMDQYAIDRQRWKKLVYQERRKASGRYVGPFGFPAKAAA